jgi:hypothetical protein
MRAYVRTGRPCIGHSRSVRKTFLLRFDAVGSVTYKVLMMPVGMRTLMNILSAFGKGFALTGKDEGSPIKNR